MYQDELLKLATRNYRSTPLSQAVKDAFYHVPRHQFVSRYRNLSQGVWIDIDEANIEDNLSLLYADQPLMIYGDENDFKKELGSEYVSTISQPSFVLRIIDILRLKKGHKVFELGTGSGWNAALMADIVGPTGKVVSVEIIKDLIERAQKSIDALGIKNVQIIHGDGSDGWEPEAPYDRIIFTAGSYELPRCFFKQIKDEGLLLFILKNKYAGDRLILLQKRGHCFQSLYSLGCEFVPLTGKLRVEDMEEVPIGTLLKKNNIENKVVASQNIKWTNISDASFYWSTFGLKSFLTVTDEKFIHILLENGSRTFGYLDKENSSFAIAYPERIDCYGNDYALRSLMERIDQWLELGEPSISDLELKVFPKESDFVWEDETWVVAKKESVFVWSLREDYFPSD